MNEFFAPPAAALERSYISGNRTVVGGIPTMPLVPEPSEKCLRAEENLCSVGYSFEHNFELTKNIRGENCICVTIKQCVVGGVLRKQHVQESQFSVPFCFFSLSK